MRVLAGLTILISPLFILPAFAHNEPVTNLIAVAAVFIFIVGLWSAQIDIMRDVHDRQSQARAANKAPGAKFVCAESPDRELSSHDLVD